MIKMNFLILLIHELVDAYGQTGDPWAFEMLKQKNVVVQQKEH